MKDDLLELYSEYLEELLLLKNLVTKSRNEKDLRLVKQAIVNSANFLVLEIEEGKGKLF